MLKKNTYINKYKYMLFVSTNTAGMCVCVCIYINQQFHSQVRVTLENAGLVYVLFTLATDALLDWQMTNAS